ncbi:FadR family transcriptional regulator [Mycobacterium manitobense]|uniref:FadR family transcriptional regulator n=1 Tax=[Mycobacterium] manitobense TaxID=190147 RepID=A0A9X2YL22_9MYCO|nr:GntR family transcriptional regulator [[Mycobacterium] manitobense]MCV7169719.1 FadR family transcriptional regulator [[Mycobacterium] manitobense]
MPLQPVHRRSVPEDVFDQIMSGVLTGEMAPGDALPSERRLAEVLGVSRPAIREALKRLAATGLVEVRQGDTTTVRDYRRHAGLDLLPRLLLHGGDLDVAVVRSIIETRLHNGPKVAELAARRRPDDLPDRLDEAVRMLDAEQDPVDRQRHALSFWDLVVDGADSIVFRLMYNTLRATYEPALPALATLMAEEVGRPDAYRAVAHAVRLRDPAAAEEAAQRLLEPASTALLTALDALEETR